MRKNQYGHFVPSGYLKEMKMSLEDRLDSLYKNRKNRALPGSTSFLATPDMVIFQNFTLGRWYNATLTLQNKDQCSRSIKVVFETTVHFRLLYPTKVIWTKVAPGMTYQLTVAFSGDEVRDFQHQVTFVTEEEEFTIPIYALKPRPLIDFPDSIKLPDVPINMTSEKNIIVGNSGTISGSFGLMAEDPCVVCPAKSVLAPNEKIFIKITLKTKTQGTTESSIIVKFDDEVLLKIKIQCNAVSSTILLQHNSISFPDTFMGLQRQVPLTIEYHGIGIGNFKWKQYKDSGMDEKRKQHFKNVFEQVRDVEAFRCVPLTETSTITREGHSLVYERIFTDEVEEVQESEHFLFKSPIFTIVPLTGEMGLNGLLEFTIIFTPQKCESYENYAYLEIAGKEERIPLKLQGTGLGPEFKLNISHLEANNIFLRSVHDYEIIVANTGHIPGSITYLQTKLEFGGKIQCLPETLRISSDHYAAFVMSFTPGEEGKFIEKVEFVINESKEKIHFIMTGNVLAPLLNLDINEIDFGIVAFGYTQSKEVVLRNNSPVPIQYHIEISHDGYQDPVPCEEHLHDVDFPVCPREFSFRPEGGVVAEESKVVGTLTIMPNVIRERVTTFVVHMWGSKNYRITIPLKYDCRVAQVACIPPKVDIKFCFINYVYDRKIVLKNMSELPCHFRFRPFENEEITVISCKNQTVCIQTDSGLTVEVTVPKHFIPPMGEVRLHLKIKTPVLGVQEVPLHFSIFGKEPEALCHVICNGQGPSICFIPPNLNFGKVTLLDTVTKDLEILNDTPIPAAINFFFRKPGAFCLTELDKRVVPPNSKQDIQISVYLTDPGRHSQLLMAQVEDGQEMAVSLTAYGEGTSINCAPKLGTKLDLGTLLTHKKYLFPLLLTNEGSRWHKMWFSRSNNLKIAKNSVNSSGGVNSVFKINPNYFHLLTRESVEVKITGSSKDQGYVTEHFYCHAVIEKSHSKHIIFSFDIIAKFVDPYLHLSKSELNFYVNVSSDGISAMLREKIKVRNDSGLGLEIDLSIHPPFYMVVDDKPISDLYLKLNNLSNRKIVVEFQPPPHQKRCCSFSQAFYVNYRDHPKVESIPVRGVTNYPTLSIIPQKVDFGCSPLGSSSQQAITLRNISPLPVIFKWVWVDDIVERKFQNSVLPTSPKRTASTETLLASSVYKQKPKQDDDLADVESIDSCFIEDKIRDMLTSFLQSEDEEEDKEETALIRTLPSCTSPSKFSQFFRIIPHEGCLEPEESIATYFRFTPQPNTEVSANVYCHIVGGANEPVTLVGKCKEISYCLSDSHICFGKIYYYEEAYNEATITNDGDGKFSFAVSSASLPSGWLNIEPTSGQVQPGETFPLTLKCYPGTVGRFETTFQIEVEHLGSTTVTVSGFGVFPQIYLNLPRPELAFIEPFITYTAIAELASETHECECACEYFPPTDRRILEDDGWVVVSMTKDEFPCTMEIDLSVERIWAKYQLVKDPHLISKLGLGEKLWPMPNLEVTPYVFDMGCRQINTKSNFTLIYLNYGPGKTVVRTHVPSSFANHEFEMTHVRHLMDLNQVSELKVGFQPTVDKYRELNTKVTEYIYMDVRNGPRIPIRLDAVVATPTLKVTHDELDFGAVRCGDCLRMSIGLINDGYLKSYWQANIEESMKVKNKLRSFFLLKEEGSLKPGEKFYLRVYFEPHYDDFLSADLIISVDGNFRKSVVPLKGIGMEPLLEITDERIFFEPCIPYSQDNTRSITIRNASRFPVEFFFSDFDEKLLQEEALIRYFLMDNMVNKVYTPHRSPGDDMPQIFQVFFEKLIAEIESKLAKQKSVTDKVMTQVVTQKGSKNRKSSLSSWDAPQTNRGDIMSKSQRERDEIITSYIQKKVKRWSRTKFSPETYQVKITPDNEPPWQDPPIKGVLVVFHGAPISDYTKTAHETGKCLNMPVCTIDGLITKSLVNNKSEAAQEVNAWIDEAFEEVAEDFEKESPPSEDSYDVVKKKVLILIEGRQKKKKPKEKSAQGKTKREGSGKGSKESKTTKTGTKSKNSDDTKKSSKDSNKAKKGEKTKGSNVNLGKGKKKHPVTDTLLDIPQELLYSLLEDSLKEFPQGLILESLRSNFLRQTMTALQCVLPLSKHIDDIYFVIFTCTFDHFIQTEDKQEEERTKQICRDLDEMLTSIDDMDDEEIEKFAEELPDVFATYIQNRKDDVVKRRQFLKRGYKIKKKASSHLVVKAETSESKIKKSRGSSKSSEEKVEKEKPKKKGSSKSTKSKKGSSKMSKSSKKSAGSESSESSKKSATKESKEAKRKLTQEQSAMKASLDAFEKTLEEILYHLEYWDKKSGTLTTPTVISQKPIKKSEKGTRSGVTLSETLSVASEAQLTNVGVNCWLIDRATYNQMDAHIPDLMKKTVGAKMSYEKQIRYDHTERDLLQTVLPKPRPRNQKKTDVFVITDVEEKVDPGSVTDTKDIDSKVSLSGKKHKSSKIKPSTSVPCIIPIGKKDNFTYRGILYPDATIKYKVSFLPKSSGNYRHQFEIGVVGWPGKFTATCIAACDIPRIEMDPICIFDRIIEFRPEKKRYTHCLFVQDIKKFEFGGVLLPNAETKTTYEVQTSFHLQNASRITCEVSFSMKKNSPVFQFKPDSHVIEPKCKKDITVVAAPTEEQIFDDSLIIAVKNNPKIERVKLTCYGCEARVDVFPKHVLFERVSLEISLVKDIVITNNTPIEITWHFVNCQKVLENFRIGKFGGKIGPFSAGKSNVEFTAKEIEVPSATFEVNVFDDQNRLVYTTEIMVSAEITALELIYDNNLDFGDVKGWNTHTIPFKITSKGSFEILCQFSNIVEEDKDLQLQREYFTIAPLEGKLPANSTFESTVTFSPDKVMTLDRFPVFTCFMVDPFHQVLIKTFNICISAKVFLSRFEMCPFSEIYYGYQPVGSEKVHIFQILNKGRFDFGYVIKNQRATEKQKLKKVKTEEAAKSKSSKESKKTKSSKNSKGSKKSKKSKGTKKSKGSKKSSKKSAKSEKSNEMIKKKVKATTLNFGIFSLTSSTGIVYPNEEAFIEVRSKPIEAGEFHETIVVNVSEPQQADRHGKILKVHVIACEPKVNFDEICNIFKEQYVVQRIDDYISSNIEAHAVFSKSEMLLRFNKVCVNTTENTRLRIQNVGHVTAHVSARFTNPNYALSVSPESFSIDPYQTDNVVVSFSPVSLDEHRSTLTLECRGFKTVDTLVVDVVGESCAPEICVLKPESEDTYFTTLHFPATLLGSTSARDVIFKNVGRIPCRCIIEVCGDDFDQLVLTPKQETTLLLNLWDPNVPMKHTNLVNLERGAVANFTLTFEPSKIEAWKAEVKIHTVNNPFETKTIYVFCEGYYMDVVLEGLYPYTRSFSNVSMDNLPVLGYALDFGHISLNTIEKKCFFIKNDSQTHTYKFEFPFYNEVLFTPAVGHLRPQTNKQVVAVFLSRNPIELYETKLDCSVYKIEYEQPQPDLLSWDDRQNLIVWCPEKTVESSSDGSSSKRTSKNESSSVASGSSNDKSILSLKKIEENPEPKINTVPNSFQNIALFVSVVAGHASFGCSLRELVIPDTFVLEKKSVTFDVDNTGIIDLKMSWFMTMQDLPRRINSCLCLTEKEEDGDLSASSIKRGPSPLNGREIFLYDEPHRSSSTSTLFSCITVDTVKSGDTWNEDDCLPFTITPSHKIIIPPDSKKTFTVTFKPVDVFDYTVHLKSQIENLAYDANDIDIEIKARSILPLYCFELEPSDYAETRRKGRKVCNDLFDENTKVVEFESVGLGIICTRTVLLKNPTKNDFIYNWRPAHEVNPHLSCFHCHTSHGALSKGKTAKMVFSFIPKECGIFEEFYYFSIPSSDIQVTFLLVGNAREPRVFFDKNHVDLPPTIVGIDVTESLMLKNEEDEKYHFKFSKLSMLADGVSIQPMVGDVPPHDILPIRILYSPKKKAAVNFDVKCVVDKIKAPLEVSISYNCLEIESTVSYTDQSGNEIQLNPKQLNVLNMGAMVPYQKYSIPFTIINLGKNEFRWFWEMRIDKISGLFDIAVDTNDEVLSPNEVAHTNLVIIPLIKCSMQAHRISLKIPYGPCYSMQLNGSSVKPPSKFSFTEYDFGACLVQAAPTKYYKTVLKFFNYNVWPMTLERGKHENHISTDFESAEVLPNQAKEMTIYFHPLTLGKHELELPFYVDGKRVHITISGKAVPLKITVVDQTQKFIDLGSVLVGKTVTRTVKVKNESDCAVILNFNFLDRLPKKLTKETPDDSIEVPKEQPLKDDPKKKVKSDTKSKGKKGSKGSKKKEGKKSGKEKRKEKKSEDGKKGTKGGKTKASSKASKKMGGKKSPKEKNLEVKERGDSKKSSKGSKVKASTEDEKSTEDKTKASSQLQITKQGIDYMTVSPEKAIKVGPQRFTDFTIKFRPLEKVEPFLEKIYYRAQHYVDAFCLVKGKVIAPDISLDRYHLTFGNVVVNFERRMNIVLRNTGDVSLSFKWLLDKKEENFSITPNKGYILPNTDLIFNVYFRPKAVKCWIKSKLTCTVGLVNKQLQLAVSGSCIHVPPPKGTIHFSCPVRESDTQSIKICNPTNQVWKITPKISGDTSFRIIEIARIPPKQEEDIDILFTPMTLYEHNATVCIPTPDGLIISYNLKGIANAPSPAGQIYKEVRCKAQHVEQLVVKNWMLVKQQFRVKTALSGRVTAKNLYSFSGNSLIEVPPSSTRIYEWTITPINEGPLELTVTFTNKATKEYLFYEIYLQVLPNKELDVIEFSTCARSPATKIIKLENPLNVPVEYKMSCPKNNLEFENSLKLEPHSVHYLEATYTPLHEEKDTKTFEATCPEMGSFCYTLQLTAFSPVPEPPIMFKTYLGHTIVQKIDVVATKNCRFTFSDSVFSLSNIIGDHNLLITFEPEQIGKFQSRLYLNSPLLGDFIYPLIGESCLPKPQGPYKITYASPAVISFKNPFSEEKNFNFYTEPGDFNIKQKSEVIGSKKVHKVVVSLTTRRTGEEAVYPITGRLIISCESPAISWVYYLQENFE